MKKSRIVSLSVDLYQVVGENTQSLTSANIDICTKKQRSQIRPEDQPD